MSNSAYSEVGALVISLDFELHWGVRDKKSVDGPYRDNLEGVWEVVPRLLELFQEFDVAATWATVGLLFADSRTQAQAHTPALKPGYEDENLDPYREDVGSSEADDPFHYAPTLIEKVRGYPRQEIGTHTFSHYYCLEPGQDSSSFEQDLTSALSIAREKGVQPRSLVFPRNQHNPDYDQVLCDAGITCYRGNQRPWLYKAGSSAEMSKRVKRLGRLGDHYLRLAGYHTTRWDDVVQPDRPLCNVPASFYVRPFSPRRRQLEPLRLRRIEGAMAHAATRKELVHLWWHPHDFGTFIDENLAFLRKVLTSYERLHRAHGMQSLSMGEVAESVLKARPLAAGDVDKKNFRLVMKELSE